MPLLLPLFPEPRPPEPEFAELFVAPRLQGAGLGRELLRRTLDHAEQSGARTRALITFAFNTASQGLYLRHGMFPRLPLYMMSGRRSDFRVSDCEPPFEHKAISAADLNALADLERSALGVSREKHHAFLLSDSAAKGFLLYEGPHCAGYAYIASSGHVGPVAVTQREYMGRAFDTALRIAADGQSTQLSAFLPGHSEAALAIAAKHRMRMTLPMVLVSDREFGDWRRYLPRNPGYM